MDPRVFNCRLDSRMTEGVLGLKQCFALQAVLDDQSKLVLVLQFSDPCDQRISWHTQNAKDLLAGCNVMILNITSVHVHDVNIYGNKHIKNSRPT